MKYLLSLIVVLVGSAPLLGQTQTITNADLEKYRLQRLAAEKELRENYRDMGFPSPEELARRNEADSRALAERSERYKKAQAERAEAAASAEPQRFVYYYPSDRGRVYTGLYLNGYGRYAYGYGPRYYPNRYRKRYEKRQRRGPGYISNPIIRGAWLRQSAPMRRTYRDNLRTTRTRVRW